MVGLSKANWSTFIPGSPRASRSAYTSGVISPRSSAMTGSPPRSARRRANSSLARAGDPAALHGRLLPGRHLPGGDEPPEVVEPDEVHQLQRRPQPGRPTRRTRPAHGVPVVVRVAPELAGLREVVGRHPGHHPRAQVLVEQVALAGRPRRPPSRGDEDRHVADELDAALAGVPAEVVPLAEEQELAEQVAAGRLGQLRARRRPAPPARGAAVRPASRTTAARRGPP